MDQIAAWTARLTDPSRCPDCGAGLPPDPPDCPGCGLPLRGPQVDRLWRLSQQAATALEQRAGVLAALRTRTDAVLPGAGEPAWGGKPAADPWRARVPGPATAGEDRAGSADGGFFGRRFDDSDEAAESPVRRRSVQHLLLGLGALLLGIAALIFTVVAWGRIGIGGRTAILAGVTAGAAAGAVLAHRRNLPGTAEALAGLTVALLLLDAYGARAYGMVGTIGAAADVYWAAVLATLAALAIAARRVLPVRVLPVAAALAAQLPLAVLADRFAPAGLTLAALAQGTVAVLLGRRAGAREVRAALGAGGGFALLAGALAAALLGYGAHSGTPVDAATAAGLLLATAAVGAAVGWDLRSIVPVPQVFSGVAVAALLAAAHAPLARSQDQDAAVLAGAALLLALALVLAGSARLPRVWRDGPLAVLGAGSALAVLGTLDPVTHAMAGQLRWPVNPWTADLGRRTRDLLGTGSGYPGEVALTLTLLTAAAAVAALRLPGGPSDHPAVGQQAGADTTGIRAVAGLLAAGSGTAAVLVLPAVLDLPYLAAVLGFVVVGGGLLVAAARLAAALPIAGGDRVLGSGTPSAGRDSTGPAGAGPGAAAATVATAGTVIAGTGAAWSLAARPATALALAGVLLIAVGAGLAGASGPGRTRVCRIAAVVGIVAAVAETWVLAVSAGGSDALVGSVTVGAAAALALAAGWFREEEVRVAAEVAAAGAAAIAFVAVVEDPQAAALALLVGGTGAALVALRRDRRRVAWLAGTLLTLSSWIRLVLAEVEHPEAYTTGPALALLTAGLLARRGGPERAARPTSWRAYGPGLVTGLVPGLVYSAGDPGLARPLLIGLVALGALLAGARHRLAGPLLIGAAVLATDALVLLGPYAVAVPRWVSIGGAGALLLLLGATYERRRRDLRVLRRRVAALS